MDAGGGAARRRRWFDSGDGTMAVLLASMSDLDDLLPTLVAYQIEWNKLATLARVAGAGPDDEAVEPEALAEAIGGSAADWGRVDVAWRGGLRAFLGAVLGHRMNLRIRMLGGSHAGYARLTRRWWLPVRRCLDDAGLGDAPVYFVSSNTHSLVNLLTGTARELEDEVVAHVEREGPQDLREELHRRRTAGRRARGRTSSTTARAGCSPGSPRRAPRGGAAWRASARRASGTWARGPRCASRRRSWTSRAWTRPAWTPGSATSTPSAWPPPTR